MVHTSRFVAVLALTIAVSGCATTGTYRSAQRAEQAEDFDRAVEAGALMSSGPDVRDIRRAVAPLALLRSRPPPHRHAPAHSAPHGIGCACARPRA